MRHHRRSPKRTLMFSLSMMLLFLLASAGLAAESMFKTDASTLSAQGALQQPFVLHLAPDADLEMIHRALDKLSVAVEEMSQIESASPFVLYIEATPDALPELRRIPGVLDVASSRPSNQTLQSGAGSITGTVTDSNGTPLPNIEVDVYLYFAVPNIWYLLEDEVTGSSGQYYTSSLSQGTYRVRFYDPEGQYAREYYDNAPDFESATNVTVTAGQTTTGIDASLEDAGHITGIMTDESGNPLENVGVRVYQYNNEKFDKWELQRSDDTNEMGQYDLGGLNTGNYRVEFYSKAGDYLSEYYDNALDIESATDIAVTVGQTTTGIDASLEDAGHITGTVTDESGNPLADIEVRVSLYNENNDNWEYLGLYKTDSEGQYDVSALNTGTYRVGFYDEAEDYLTEYYDNAPDFQNATDIAVIIGQTTTGINASLSPAGRITGTVTDESDNPLAYIQVRVYQYNEQSDDWQSQDSDETNSKGQYDLGGLNTGSYRVRFYDYKEQYATEYYDNALDIESATDIAVTAGQTTTGIEASLTLKGRITGTVTDESGNPLTTIQVNVYRYNEQSDDWQSQDSDETNSKGQYDLGGLNTGSYRVRFYDYKEQYATEYYDNALDIESATDIAVTSGQTTTGIDASLSLKGRITGTVTNESNNPLANIRVSLYQYNEQSGEWQSFAEAFSDEIGQYEFGPLNTGTYRVGFEDYQGQYVTQYYDNALDIESATDITVTAGQVTTGIDASLTLKGRITGTVTDESSNPLASIGVRVYRYNGQFDNWSLLGSDYTDEIGQYEISGLNTGIYRMEFYDTQSNHLSEYYDNALDIESATDIAVTVGQVTTGIDASLRLGGRITGTVTDESNNPLADIGVRVYQYNQESDDWQSLDSDDTDEIGQYEVGGLNTGTYRLHFYDDEGKYATEYYNNALDIESATDITVTAGEVTTGIDASLEDAGHITGTVTDQSSNPLANIDVSVYQYNEQFDDWQLLGSDNTDSQGQYDVGALNTGTYRIGFDDYQYATEYYDNALDIESATDIAVTSGQTTTEIDASLTLWGRITGIVTDESGNPLADIRVRVYQYNEQFDEWLSQRSDNTDEYGQYEFGALNTGTYRVEFYDYFQDEYVTQYYHNALDIEGATEIIVMAGQTTTGIDASLSLKGHIAGTVTDESNNPLANIGVIIYQYNEQSDNWQSFADGYSDSEGQYDAGDLNPGTYRVRFYDQQRNYLSEYYDNALEIEKASDIVVIAGQTITGIDASLEDAGHITGTVTDAEGKPLPNIHVRIYEYNEQSDHWHSWHYDDTDSQGQYEVGLNTGTYRVAFYDYFQGQYATEYYDNALDIEGATDIAVTVGQTTTGIDASLRLAGQITGTVTDADGNPLPNIYVRTYQYNEQSNDWQRLRDHSTDEIGQYDVRGLNTGTYRVGFLDLDHNYLAEYYDNALDLESATDIAVTAGQTTTGIDVSLSLKGHITGTVSDESGNPLRDIEVNVYQYNDLIDNWERTASDHSNFYGQYDVDGLTPGTYRVHFLDLDNNYLSEYYDNGDDLESATDVMVIEAQTTSEIDASLAIGASLAGTVRASDGSLLENVAVDVYRSDGNGGWQWAGGDDSNGIGNYVVTGLPTGTYRVGFFDWAGVYFPKYYEDTTDLDSATEIALTAGESRAEIDITLAEGGHITGTVSHQLSSLDHLVAGTSPLEGIEVHAYRNQGGEWQWVRSATTNASGEYDIGGLASGSYRVGFFEPFGKYAYEYYHDSSNLAQASNISVTAGQSTPNIDATLTDAAEPLAQVTSEGGVSVDAQTGQITIAQRNGNTSDVTISLLVTCPDGETASDVTLLVAENSYFMTTTGNQQYSSTIPANAIVDDAQIIVSNLCNGNTEEQEIGQIQRFEPTGQITDAETGEPVAGATVVLYKVPGWQVRTSPAQNNTPHTCNSKLSRPSNPSWSQEAPTELGVMALPDSDEIEPAINPLQSDAEGYYGWHVVRGCWYVVVEAAGYDRFVSPVVGMPPDITDLDLSLMPKEPLRIQFRAVNYQLNENHGTAQVTVIVTTPPTQTLTVDYSTSNNSATAGEDYTTATGTLTFAPGETINAFNVPILDDDAKEGNEIIDLTLSHPTNVALGERDQATVTITDDDAQITSSHKIYLPMMIRTSD